MVFLLGIDTGGTFTDAVILDDSATAESAIVAKVKSLTTRPDLSGGISAAVQDVLARSACAADDIGLVSLSTTLATNALVEGQGERVALIAIGFDERDMKKAGLETALGNDPVVILPGGHTTHGSEASPLDMEPLKDKIEALSDHAVGFAVVGYFAVRNPAHEVTVADFVRQRTGKPVTCSHELTANLNGPKRALTTLLNARLIPMIAGLIDVTQETLNAVGVTAPLMVVRGDGAFVGADFAQRRPIETILSGPAASLVGTRYLTGIGSAIVNDVGGTTSDVALLEDGGPKLDPRGALVGGYRTMVEAVAIRTFGLGGDSEIALGGSVFHPQLVLGPRRAVPVSLIAKDHPDIVHSALDKQLKSPLPECNDGRFAYRLSQNGASGLSVAERSVLQKLELQPAALAGLLDGHAQSAALSKLVSCGLAQISALTPSDALHVTGEQQDWDADAARKALTLFGRRRDGTGQAWCPDPAELAKRIVARMRRRSAEVVLETAFAAQGGDTALTSHPLVSDIIDRRETREPGNSIVDVSLTLDRPLIGLGASAHVWHPTAAALLGTKAVVPEHADVANAVGAVVGRISVTAKVTVSQPTEGRFHVAGTQQPFAGEKAALERAEESACAQVEDFARQAGAAEFQIRVACEQKRADVEGRDVLVEAVVTAIATGRPAISRN